MVPLIRSMYPNSIFLYIYIYIYILWPYWGFRGRACEFLGMWGLGIMKTSILVPCWGYIKNYLVEALFLHPLNPLGFIMTKKQNVCNKDPVPMGGWLVWVSVSRRLRYIPREPDPRTQTCNTQRVQSTYV